MFLRLLCTGKDPTEYEDDDLSVRCLEHCTRHDVWGLRRENTYPKAYVIRIINTPGNSIKRNCKSA